MRIENPFTGSFFKSTRIRILLTFLFPVLIFATILFLTLVTNPSKVMAGSCPTGGYYCGNDGLGLNSSTLYYCTGAGANPQVSQNCSNGCKINPPGVPDQCNSAPSGPCPSSGDYCGGTVGQNANDLYYCSGAGANPTLKQTCSSNGCQYNPEGTADVCKPSGPCPSSGDYCGGTVGQNSNNLYYCSGAGANPTLKQTCSTNGCQYNPQGTADVCKPSGPCPSSGDYCGGTVGQNANDLYYCSGAGANPTLKQTCSSNGCQYNPSGTADVCKVAPSGNCPNSGDYCGGSIGENINNLYYCSGAGADPTLKSSCSNGCKVFPEGTADVCKAPAPTSCPGNGDYCGSSVGQNPDYLYTCSAAGAGAGAAPQLKESCNLGCHINPPGTRDVCTTATTAVCPNGDGLYCGASVQLDANTLYSCTNGNYTVSQTCNNGCQQNAPGVADVCKTTTPSSSQQIIFPMQVGSQNVSDFKVEPGFIYGSGPVYIWSDCLGGHEANTSANKYHGGIDIIASDAKGTLEIDTSNSSDVTACKKGSKNAQVVTIGSGTMTDLFVGEQGGRITMKLDVKDLDRTVYVTYMHINIDQSILDAYSNSDPSHRNLPVGQLLGTVGDFSPNVSNPHLHFQVTTSPDWGGGYSSSSNPELDDNGFINPCAFFLRHGASVPANCPNVTPNGGQVTSVDSDIVLTFPPNAVNQDVIVQLNKLTGNYITPLDQNLSLAGNAYQLTALTASGVEISNFDEDVMLEIKYNEDLLAGKDFNRLSLFYFDLVAKHWVEILGNKIIDPVKKVLKINIPHFSEYAVIIENTPPVITQIPSQTITQGQLFTAVNLETYGSDLDVGDVLTWNYSGNTNITISIDNNIATLSYPESWSGSENITFTVTDDTGASASSSSEFRINPNTPSGVELLTTPWHLTGNNGASEKYKSMSTDVLEGKTTLRITYDLHGLYALDNDASAIIFDQNGWNYISLSDYGVNGKDGIQTVDIPLSDFAGLNLATGSNTIHTRFWYWSAFTVDIYSIQVLGLSGVNYAPAITSTPVITGNENTLYTYDVEATDPENNTLTYSLIQGNTGMSINPSTGVISWIPSYNDSGTSTITVAVNDGTNSVNQSYDLVVNNVNRAPNFSQIPGQSIIKGQEFATIDLGSYGSDPDSGDSLNWSYSGNTNISVAIANNIATLTYLTTWAGGSENITFEATDSFGAVGISSATFTVSEVSVGTELLSSPWHLTGNNGASEKYKSISTGVLAGKTTLRITYDLHGLNALGGDASAIIFDQNGWKYISLSNYGINGKNGTQIVDIPLSAFPGLNLTTGSNTIHTRFWYGSAFVVDITSIKVF